MAQVLRMMDWEVRRMPLDYASIPDKCLELLEGLDTFDDVSVSSVADDDDMSESENDYGDDEDIDEGIFPQEQKVDGDEWGGISSTSPSLEAASNEAPELIPGKFQA
jgi:hypothetical protein